jgi:hypothetical protein
VDWTSADCMASSVAGSNSDEMYPVVTSEGAHLLSPPHPHPPFNNIEDLVGRLQATVATVDANMLRRVRENALLRSRR